MLRSIAAVVVSFIVMFIIINIALFGAMLILGWRMLEGNTYQATTAFTVFALVVSLLAAVIGGWLCRKIARSTKPVTVMAALVFGMGVLMALGNLGKKDLGARDPAHTIMEAVSKSREQRQPDWYVWMLPITGALGIMAGGGKKNYVSPEHIPAPGV